MSKARGKARAPTKATAQPTTRLSKRQQQIAEQVVSGSGSRQSRTRSPAKGSSALDSELSDVGDDEDDDGEIKGEFGRWGSEWIAKFRDLDEVWGSDEGFQLYCNLLGFKPQPLEHCEDNLFPNAAALWGLKLHKVRKGMKYTFMTKGRGPSCYITPSSKKTPCHYHEHSFPFLYDPPNGLTCLNALKAGCPTLIVRWDPVEGFIAACAYCFYTTKSNCTLVLYKLTWQASAPYTKEELEAAKIGRSRNWKVTGGTMEEFLQKVQPVPDAKRTESHDGNSSDSSQSNDRDRDNRPRPEQKGREGKDSEYDESSEGEPDTRKGGAQSNKKRSRSPESDADASNKKKSTTTALAENAKAAEHRRQAILAEEARRKKEEEYFQANRRAQRELEAKQAAEEARLQLQDHEMTANMRAGLAALSGGGQGGNGNPKADGNRRAGNPDSVDAARVAAALSAFGGSTGAPVPAETAEKIASRINSSASPPKVVTSEDTLSGPTNRIRVNTEFIARRRERSVKQTSGILSRLIATLQDEKTKLERDIEVDDAELEERMGQIAEDLTQPAGIEAMNKKLTEDLQNSDSLVQALQGDVKRAEDALSLKEQEMIALKNTTDAKLANLSSETKLRWENFNKLTKARAEVAELRESLTSAQADGKTLSAAWQSQQSEIQTLRQQCSEALAQSSSTAAENSQLQQRYTHLENTNNGLEAEVTALRAKIAELESHNKFLTLAQNNPASSERPDSRDERRNSVPLGFYATLSQDAFPRGRHSPPTLPDPLITPPVHGPVTTLDPKILHQSTSNPGGGSESGTQSHEPQPPSVQNL